MNATYVLRTVADWHGIEWQLFKDSGTRWREISLARREAFWLARKHTGRSYPIIARVMGFDHSSVLQACRRFEEMIAEGTAPDRSALLLAGERPEKPEFWGPIATSTIQSRKAGRDYRERALLRRHKGVTRSMQAMGAANV